MAGFIAAETSLDMRLHNVQVTVLLAGSEKE